MGMVNVWRLIRINKALKIGKFLLEITLKLSPEVSGSSRSPKLLFLL
jgi:hypothetical protein